MGIEDTNDEDPARVSLPDPIASWRIGAGAGGGGGGAEAPGGERVCSGGCTRLKHSR